MKHINSINGINQQADLSKPGNNVEDVSSQKAANSKLLSSLQSQSQSMRAAAQDNSQLSSSKINERAEYSKDFNNSNKTSQESSETSVNKIKESIDLMSSSFFKKTESRLLKEQAKTEPGEVAQELKRQSKEKLKEAIADFRGSFKAYNKSQEEDMNAFQASMDASNSQDLASGAQSQSNQAQVKAVTYNNQANRTSAEATTVQTQQTQSQSVQPQSSQTQSGETKDASGGSLFGPNAGLFSNPSPTAYNGMDQSRANDSRNSKGIFATGGGVSEITGNGAVNSNNNANANANASAGASNGADPSVDTNGADGLSAAGNAYLDAARMMLRVVMQVTIGARSSNPIVQISKNLTNKSLSDQAIAYLEAANVDTALNGTAVNQQIILTKAQASTISGEAQTGINYWKQVLEGNKQLQKETHDMSKAAG
jgi:hypothetical protein